jgi:hypothetical protein
MTIDDLVPEEREEVQRHYVDAWHARRRRAEYGRIHTEAPRITYDVAGRLIAMGGEACAPRLTAMLEDGPAR